MAKRQYIPRPRHLFPETAAFLIGLRRTALYLGFGTRTAVGRIPVWTGAALAGITSVMLSVMLFFIRDDVQAAPSSAPLFTPIVQQLPTNYPVYTTPVQLPVPVMRHGNPLSINLAQTDFPFPFDESRLTTSTSLDFPPQIPVATETDLWHSLSVRATPAEVFRSYIEAAPKLSATWGPLEATDTVPRRLAPDAARGMGLVIEKVPLEGGGVGEPLKYEIHLTNVSLKPIEQVTVRETVSALQRVSQTLPSASLDQNQLVWTLTGLEPGVLTKLQVTIVPEMEGEIRTEAIVQPETRFSAAVNVSPRNVPQQTEPVRQPVESQPIPTTQPKQGKPELKLTSTRVPNLKERDVLSMTFSVTNVGTAAADKVVLYVRLSGEFRHMYGDYVEHRINNLAPGQTRRALLQATAHNPGDARLSVSLTMQGWEVEAREVRVPIAPDVAARNGQAALAESSFSLIPPTR